MSFLGVCYGSFRFASSCCGGQFGDPGGQLADADDPGGQLADAGFASGECCFFLLFSNVFCCWGENVSSCLVVCSGSRVEEAGRRRRERQDICRGKRPVDSSSGACLTYWILFLFFRCFSCTVFFIIVVFCLCAQLEGMFDLRQRN